MVFFNAQHLLFFFKAVYSHVLRIYKTLVIIILIYNILNMNFILDVLGTPAYFAPETLNCVISDAPSGYGKAVDL